MSTAPAATSRLCITNDEAQAFLRDGYLILRQVLHGEELRQLQAATKGLIEAGIPGVVHPDYMYGQGHKTGAKVLKRIEYVIDKTYAGKVLLGHPFILRSVERLQGRDFFPTWDSLVFKLPHEGIIVPWHRDGGADCVGDKPIFNVDFYLDEADQDTCVWAYPGSHLWSTEKINAIVQQPGFSTAGAVPIYMQPGDVLLHNIHVLHGSPSNSSAKLRRVLYYEFRTAHVEEQIGPHVPAYIPVKQQVLLKCQEIRAACPYVTKDEVPFVYRPTAPYDRVPAPPKGDLPTYRFPHHLWWRS